MIKKEEAIRILYVYSAVYLVDASHREAFDIAIKALEQEPCEDCVSREEAIDACNQSVNILEATDRIKDLPSVYPKAKVGKWIEEEDYLGDMCYRCSVCNELFTTMEYEPKDSTMNYCTNCGAKMEKIESEE